MSLVPSVAWLRRHDLSPASLVSRAVSTNSGRTLFPCAVLLSAAFASASWAQTPTVRAPIARTPIVRMPIAQAAFAPRISKTADGGYAVAGAGYNAVVNKDGYLSSFKVGALETLGGPISYTPGANLVADTFTPEGDTLHVHLKGGGEATIDYLFRRDGITVTPTLRSGDWASFAWNGSPSLLGIELLNDKSPEVGDAIRFVDRGEVRGVPAFRSERNQMVRLHYPGFALHTYVQRWGAPFNYESAGGIRDYQWTASLLSGNQAFPVVLTIQRAAADAKTSLPAVSFAPRATKVASLYYSDEPCVWNLDLGDKKRYQALLDAGINAFDVAWSVLDIHNREVASGKSALKLDATAANTVSPVTITTPGSGYYQVMFRLSEASGRMLPSSFQTRFTVINRVAGLMGRDDTLEVSKGVSDYATVSMIGVGGIRESHNIGGFFTNSQPPANEAAQWVAVANASPAVWMNTKRLDDVINYAASESRKYKLQWFFQANSRPDYATPAVYEAMAYALVSRYKDRCRVWEVENEPNFGYTPADYVTKCLIPFSKGARRADPGCIIMGPDCVGVKPTLEFMTVIYKMGAGRYLDEVSTHTYPGPGESWEQFGNLPMLQRLRALMDANGHKGKPLWQTEQGYTWDSNPKNRAARYATRMFLQGARMGIEPQRQYYFYPNAHGFESWYQAGNGEEGSGASWLPLAAAQHFLAENTTGMKYAGDIKSPYKGVYLSRFTGATEDVIAAWTFDFPLALPVRAPGLKVVNGYMGAPLKIASSGGVVTLPLSGEPIYVHVAKGSAFEVAGAAFGRNLAASEAGGVATASSFAGQGDAPSNDGGASSRGGNAPDAANDGNWNLWEPALDLPGRTAWRSGQKDPSTANPDWLQITFPVPRTINRMMALCYLPAVNASPRDWEFQAEVNGQWKTLGGAKEDETWSLYREFAPVTTSKVRLVVTQINDGWQGSRRWMPILMGPKATNYTDSRVLVSELEAYGPQASVSVAASVKNPVKRAAFQSETVSVQVQNNSGKALDATLQPQLPDGFTASPASLPVRMAAGEKQKTLSFTLNAPARLETGTIPVAVRLNDAGGKPLDAAQLALEVQSPVTLTPQSPTALNPASQPLSVAISNMTEQPLKGVVSMSLGAGGAAPVEKPFGPIAAGASATVEFQAPNLDLIGKRASVLYSVRANNLVTTARQELALRGWQVLGPFAPDFDKSFAPEAGVDLNKSYEVMGGAAKWKPALSDASGLVALNPLFNPNNNVSAYATIWVRSPQARRAIASAGSDDGIKLWLNGKIVISNNTGRGAAPGQDEAPVDLKSGWNQVLIRITQGGGGWGFYFDLLDAKTRQPLSDIEYSPRPPA